MKRRVQGFTMIELIAVIVILGVLSATALPKLIDLQGHAQMARAQGTAASLSSALHMAHMKWHLEGQPEAIMVGDSKIVFQGGAPIPESVLELVRGLERDRDVVFTEAPGQVNRCVVAYVFQPDRDPAYHVDKSGITHENCVGGQAGRTENPAPAPAPSRDPAPAPAPAPSRDPAPAEAAAPAPVMTPEPSRGRSQDNRGQDNGLKLGHENKPQKM